VREHGSVMCTAVLQHAFQSRQLGRFTGMYARVAVTCLGVSCILVGFLEWWWVGGLDMLLVWHHVCLCTAKAQPGMCGYCLGRFGSLFT
jgi:hypothetical protein